jgi:tetratricopeptide (TPR) repeat protein
MNFKFIFLIAIILLFSCYTTNDVKQYEKYNQENMSKILFPFNNQNLIFLGFDFDTSKYKTGDIIKPGDKIGNIQSKPNIITNNEKNQQIINEARNLYNNKNYKQSSEKYKEIYESEKDNLLYLEEFGKALYWSDNNSRITSFNIFKKIVNDIEDKNCKDSKQTAIHFWFIDSYFKLGCIYIDLKDYKNAIYYLTKGIYIDLNSNSTFLEQGLSYITECYYNLNNKEFNNFFYLLTKKKFPSNKYIERFKL